MAGTSNYGSVLTFGGSAIGPCIVTAFPEVVMDDADTTSHDGTGYASSIPTGLVRIGDLTLSVLAENGTYSTLRGYQTSKTIDTVEISNTLETVTGDGWVKSVKIEDADATDPDAVKLTVVFACTGAWS